MFLPRRECNLQIDDLCDDRVGSAIEESKNDWWNQSSMEFVFGGEVSIDETVS